MGLVVLSLMFSVRTADSEKNKLILDIDFNIMSVLRPKTIILSAQPVRPMKASVIGGDGALIVGQQTITDYESLIDDDEDSYCGIPRKRRRLTFLSPEQKLVRRLVQFLLRCFLRKVSLKLC